jgi:hypothetical protein
MVPTYLQWNPGLDNDELTLKEVIDTLPGNGPMEIHKLVRLFENPDSPLAFKGAINLPRHDCVHIVLGRGLSAQDEAFVIGFTMGTSKNISRFEVKLFEFVSKHFYPGIYKFTDDNLKIFELGVKFGKECAVNQIYDFPFELYMERKLGEIREIIGISKDELREIYRKEQEITPNTMESKRLPL